MKGSDIDLPCSRCYACKAKKVAGWSFRIMKEAEVSTSAFFLTLTYAPEHVPITKNGFMTLLKKDVQNFMKRFRKTQTNKLKYYAVGEYGEALRPHYHIIIFNMELEEMLSSKECNLIKQGLIILDGKHPMNIPSWEKGHVTIGQLSPASAQYTLKYVSKDSTVGKHDRDDRQKEFSLMSKKLGANYLTKSMRRWHKKDILNRMYVRTKDGINISMPRYYKDKIYTTHQKKMISAHLKSCGKLYDEDLGNMEQLAIHKQRKAQKETRKTSIL